MNNCIFKLSFLLNSTFLFDLYHPNMRTFFFLSFILFLSSVSFSQVSKKVHGSMIDQRTENAIQNVNIVLENINTKDTFSTKTDATGTFQFNNIPLGRYEFKVIDPSYIREQSFFFDLTEDHIEHFTFSEPISAKRKAAWMFDWGHRKIIDANGNVYIHEHYWSHLVGKIILSLYGLFLLLIFFYSTLQLNLAITYAKNRRKRKLLESQEPQFNIENAPKVTVQLPMFNELYVAERIIEACANFDYPTDRLHIQVLDDSTDETKELISTQVAKISKRGINIEHIHRNNRTGYKAGALDDAMKRVEGDFIAIFDSDFIPEPDFLKRTMPYFQDERIGLVQTRWGHINKNYSLLTELQAFGLNGHFAIEQGGRNSAQHFINFNGTGGIWRKKCIEDAGGWEHDTLTEDLDLSYRAQMKGWRFCYLEHVVSPAELPITMSALKNQQHRWMKGGVECFKKMSKRLITAKNIRFSDRIHGISHLFNSSVFLFILMVAILSLPVLHIKDSFEDLNYILRFMSIFVISTLFLMIYYWYSFRERKSNGKKPFWLFIGRFFLFLIMSMGMSINNTIAVVEGYLGIKSSFVRTPKFNVARKTEIVKNKYDKKKISIAHVLEAGCAVLFLFTAINRAIYGDLGMVPFHLMLGIGFSMVFYYSIIEIKQK